MLARQDDFFSDIIVPLYEATRPEWLAAARDVARQIAQSRGRVTVDEVRALVPIPLEWDARVAGSIFHERDANGEKVWQHCGFTKTVRASSHGRPISEFRLVSP